MFKFSLRYWCFSTLIIISMLSKTTGYSHYDLIVIGGGPAGIFGAISAHERAAQLGKSIKSVVFEQGSEALTKVRISGGGRCNVMHDEFLPAKEMVRNYPRGRYTPYL